MKHILLSFKEMIVWVMLVFFTSLSYGQAGFNTTYIVLDSNNSGNVYYDLQASTANPDFDNSNLGVYCEGSSSLVFKGAEHNNYKCGGCDITSTRLMYRIYPTGSPSGSFVSNSIGYSSGFTNGCGGEDQQWSNTGYNTNLLSGLSAGNYTIEVYSEQSTTCLGTVYASNGGNNFKATFTVNTNVTYYLDADNDGFGTNSVSQVSCTGAPIGYVSNNFDCNDNQLQYLDADGDGFGSMTLVGCGVANNSDCNDSQLQYLDADGDGFGSNNLVACGVTNNADCNDNQLQYLDTDGDGFGSMTLVGCGVANNSDCNDSQLQYLDADGDGFGANIAVACGVTNNFDCNDNQLQYQDADGDGFGNPAVLVACGLANNNDTNDSLLTYVDNDGDGFGQNTFAPSGPTNNFDCNDNQLQYLDADGDGFGNPAVLVACGLSNNIDSNDGLLTYVDNDGDGFGQNTFAPSGPTNNFDCNDNQLQYQDADGDGFGNPAVLVACGLSNNIDSNDGLLTYVDNDGDGFGQNTFAPSGPTNNFDCNDNQLQYQDADGDGFGNPAVLMACGLSNNIDSNDGLLTYVDNDGDGFGQNTFAPSGPTNNFDCNDNQLQYQDADGDGFGNPAVLVACGLANNNDTNDSLLTYVDNDGDGFGQNTFAPSGPTNNFDCNDNQLQYQDADGDGFGNPAVLVACGLSNNIDSNDGLLTYVDNDGDGFGQNTFAPSGPTNNFDCNDNQLQYQDADGDGFGNPAVLVACGLSNNIDSNDGLLTYVDNDSDGFGQNTFAPSGPTNNFDCNDNVVFYQDNDGDGLGSSIFSACSGITNNNDCNDNDFFNLTGITYYQDADGDGFGNPVVTTSACTPPVGYVLDNSDCNDSNSSVHPGAIDVCYDGIDNDCNGIIDNACIPIVSVVQGAQCGTTLSTINQSIYANLVVGAQGYRFRVTDLTTNQVQTIDRNLRVFQLTQLTNYAFNRTYQIEVSVRYNNVWQPFYGLPCTVATPSATTQIQTAQCGGTLTTINDVIYANSVPFASGYKFRITNLLTSAQEEVERPLREIKMTQTSIAEFNATYSVEVAVKNTNGTYLPYGTACNITTPSFPTTQLQLSQCDVSIANNSTTIYADSYAGATTYRFRFTNTNLGYTYQFDRSLRSFVLSSVPGLLPGETYSVQVSIEIGGVFGPFGKVCTLTTPGGSSKLIANESDAELRFDAIASPNPFGDNFGIKVSTSLDETIQVKVYDMLGKLVVNEDATVSNIGELTIGADLPSGVYSVVVSQKDQVKTLRVIKR